MALVMTVEPGKGGQPFMEEMIAEDRRGGAARFPDPVRMTLVEVDGGIDIGNHRRRFGGGSRHVRRGYFGVRQSGWNRARR